MTLEYTSGGTAHHLSSVTSKLMLSQKAAQRPHLIIARADATLAASSGTACWADLARAEVIPHGKAIKRDVQAKRRKGLLLKSLHN